MHIYAIGNLHFSGVPESKPMDVFGEHWKGHRPRIIENWKQTVTPEDMVILCGDISWAIKLPDAVKDDLREKGAAARQSRLLVDRPFQNEKGHGRRVFLPAEQLLRHRRRRDANCSLRIPGLADPGLRRLQTGNRRRHPAPRRTADPGLVGRGAAGRDHRNHPGPALPALLFDGGRFHFQTAYRRIWGKDLRLRSHPRGGRSCRLF